MSGIGFGVRKLPVLEGPVVGELNACDVGGVGVVAPDEKADNPVLAGVDGGGRGANDVSDVAAENGLCVSDDRWCL